jgi:hypothetical protein
MSDRLAVSASLSVLMMSIYVLFSSDVARAPIGPDRLTAPHAASTHGLPGNLARLLISSR